MTILVKDDGMRSKILEYMQDRMIPLVGEAGHDDGTELQFDIPEYLVLGALDEMTKEKVQG